MVALYNTGEPTRAFTELSMRMKGAELIAKRPMIDGAEGAGRGFVIAPDGKKVSCGPVTVQLAGPGSGWIPRKCNRYHGDPQKKCSAGIPPGMGFPANIVGQCAYEH